MMALRTLAETHSLTTTVATMMSRMTLTFDQARFSISSPICRRSFADILRSKLGPT